MAYEVPGQKFGNARAAADLSALQYRGVVANASGQIAQQTTAGARCDGVLQNKPTANLPAEVMVSGVSKFVAGAAVAQGALVTVDAVGRAVTAAVGNFVLGRAELAAAAAGDIISVLLTHDGVL